ncbi:MAG: hypothetical protein NTY19_39475 [Planctomycetota bacterium]|nr:hypothetical protein [Planctomycetota bacterium]
MPNGLPSPDTSSRVFRRLPISVGTGFTDTRRQNPPPVGRLATYRYQEFTDRDVPRFPSFVRMRLGADMPVPT